MHSPEAGTSSTQGIVLPFSAFKNVRQASLVIIPTFVPKLNSALRWHFWQQITKWGGNYKILYFPPLVTFCKLPCRDTSTHTSICARACLDRRRLEEAHMKYAVLSMYQRYTTHFSKWSIAPSIKQTLEDVTPTFYRAFSAYYTCECPIFSLSTLTWAFRILYSLHFGLCCKTSMHHQTAYPDAVPITQVWNVWNVCFQSYATYVYTWNHNKIIKNSFPLLRSTWTLYSSIDAIHMYVNLLARLCIQMSFYHLHPSL